MNNTVILVGRLVKDIELRFTQNNKAVTDFTLAVNRDKDNTDFIRIQSWGKSAEALANYTKKGDMIGVKGFLRHESYEDKEGNRKNFDYVLAESTTFLNTNKQKKEETREKSNSEIIKDVMADKDPFEEFAKGTQINDSDLPF